MADPTPAEIHTGATPDEIQAGMQALARLEEKTGGRIVGRLVPVAAVLAAVLPMVQRRIRAQVTEQIAQAIEAHDTLVLAPRIYAALARNHTTQDGGEDR